MMDARNKRKRAYDPDSKSLVQVDVASPTLETEPLETEPLSYVPKRRRRLTSAVWNDFEKIKKDGADVAMCKYCKKELSGSSSSGTTHLNNHLKRCPRKTNLGNNLHTWFTNSTEKKREGGSSVRSFKYDEKRSRLELVRMIIYHEYPFTIVEHVGFRRFVYSLCPSFNMLSRNVIESDCMALYENEKKKIYDKLDKLSCRVSLTLDLWISCQNTGYLCLMVHYLNDNWQLKKRIINFMSVDECHTGELFANYLMARITDWNIHHKLFSLTIDDDCVDEGANAEIKNRLCQGKLLLSSGQFFNVQCASYIINSIAHIGFEKINKVIVNIRECIEICSSSEHHQIFDAVIQELNFNAQRGLHIDIPTQWNSTFSMLQVALEFKEVFDQFHSRVPESICFPSEEQWAEARAVCNCLKIFYDVTKLLSSTEHPTANLFFEEFCEIHLQLVEWCNSSDELVSSLASMMKEKFDNYWDKYNTTLAVASVLDPRYKMKLVECYYPQIYGSSAEEHIKEVVESFRNLYNEYANSGTTCSANGHGLAAESVGNGSDGILSIEGSAEVKEKLRRFDRFLQENTQTQHLKTDMDEFLDEGVFPRDKDKSFSVWDWWRANAAKYPILSRMARDVLAISVSTVTLESAFSLGNRVLDAYRSSLGAETVQALICMQDWLREEMGGTVSSVVDSVCPSVMDMPTCSPERSSIDVI